MFKNYFKIARRNLFRNKGFSITNILGLTIGITCTIFIFLWVQNELSYDKFQKNYDNIYQVMANRDFDNTIFTDQNMVLPLASSLQKTYPQIKNAVVTTGDESHTLSYGNKKLNKTGLTVGGDFFYMFSWIFLKGSAADAISDPNSIVLSQSAAKSFFGNTDPINKVLKIDNQENMRVSAVVADPPGNSSIQFDFVRAFNYSDPEIKDRMNEWVNSSSIVYLQMVPGANIPTLEKNINALKKQHNPQDHVSTYFAFPMSKWHLYSDFKDGKNVGGMIEYVRLFTIIAIIILLLACINFMNLSTARSEKRAKEVGVRKVLGSGKKLLILQFFFESMILVFIAFVLSIIAVCLLMPSFNSLVDKHLSLDISQPYLWIGGLTIILFTGIVAGSYPALYLSSFNPAKVLKGAVLKGKSAVIPRRILVVGQFVISILLISATIIVYQQIHHVKQRDLGYNQDNLIMIPTTPDVNKNYTVIKEELLKSGFVNSVTTTFSPMTEIWWRTQAPHWDGQPVNSQLIVTGFSTDVDFAKTIGVKILEGKDFNGLPSDSSAMMLNKAAVKAMGLKNPIGTQMRFDSKNYTVTGITDDVVMESPFTPVVPMIIFYRPENSNIVDIRLNQSANLQNALKSMEAIFKKYNPSVPYEYQFADEEFGKKFLTEELIGMLTNIFAGMAIFICCMGLAGLASFTVEKRLKEIGIRKVLGSSVRQLLLLISSEFLKLVLLAFIIATPLSYWILNNWLQNYDYHIQISLWLFVAVGFGILLLTLAVVSLNTLKAANANPVKSLRSE